MQQVKIMFKTHCHKIQFRNACYHLSLSLSLSLYIYMCVCVCVIYCELFWENIEIDDVRNVNLIQRRKWNKAKEKVM